MSFENGNKSDQKHYWLTPSDLMEKLQEEFGFDYDPCPFPKPQGYDGLLAEWGQSNYVNPPFGSYTDEHGHKKGPTAWARKALEEHAKGKQVVLLYPIDKWIHMLLEAGAKVRNLHDIRWMAIEDGSQGPGTGRWVAMFILDHCDDGEEDTVDGYNVGADVEIMRDALPENLGEAVLMILENHKGREKAISRRMLVIKLAQLDASFNFTREDRPVRLAINLLRKQGAPVCSTGGIGGGYFLARDASELEEYLAAEVHSRAMDLLEQEGRMREGARRYWENPVQPRLF